MNWRKLFAEKPKPPVKAAKGNFISYAYGAAFLVALGIGFALTIDNTEVQEALGLRLYHILVTVTILCMSLLYVAPAISYGLRWHRLRKQA